ncbi:MULTISPECIES: glycoside hydrolase family 3 C-terminal domain-containing protein [Massilia]|uniref:Glycosyl hydrolase n=2 Tax=Massilia TaxID=149698 RepID=A0A7X3FVR9_9BURK|nr:MULTISPECIES: glycoside hydrolase family 3 C-terminal domain-containing protein [Telluria group]KQY00327.1 beta-glucosidase [Massilia sp. Root133]KQZ38963.1 beta-glucosidase [Massilia sp. Root1485]MDN4045825.1 glycoside hydrolase family 3 C-terminal domain-containing protein [Massilia sp. YIM B02787]MVW58768.1 glycosyl hydrolase [Telluria cellulosilytica]
MRLNQLTLVAALAAAFPLFATAADAPAAPAQKPWLDRSLSADKRAELAVKAMTREEKLRWVFGYFGTSFAPKGTTPPKGAIPFSAGFVPGNPRLGLPDLLETDAGLGVATQATPTPRERTALPSGLATASTWDTQMAYAGGAMIGSEARLSGFNVMLAGGVNLMRDPRNGRNFEYAGEDPLLAGTMVGHAVKGIESNHVISTVKHYALNDQETGRNEHDVRIDKAAARMSDLLAMQLALEQSDAGSVMCSYNRVFGTYACENDYLLNEVLKKDWGFKGYVMSDWGATHSTVQAANNGLDRQSGQEFDKSPYFGGALDEAVKNGYVSEARLDDMATRIVRAMFAKGVVDNPVAQDGKIDFAKDGAVSRATAEEGIVLLKNDNKVLPLSKDVKTIAVIGGHADVGVLSGGGSSQVYPVGGNAVPGLEPKVWPGPVVYYPSSPLRHIQALAPNAKVVYDDGTDPARAARVAAQADVALVFATQWIGEANDATSLALPDNQDTLIDNVAGANPRTVVVLETGGPVAMPWVAKIPAVLEAWYPGTSGGEAIARVLFGAVNPSGHLPATFPVSEQQLPRPTLDGDPKQPEQRFTVDYKEGAAIGYKWFDQKGLTPLFPFGHGLSYTTFSYSGLASQVKDGRLHVRFKVTNTGNVAGKDVPQVYVSPLAAKWEAPKRLAGWDKVALQPGESKEVDVVVEPRILGLFDEKSKTWRIAKGKYKLVLAEDAAGKNATSVTVDLPASTLDVRGRQRK